MPSLVLASLVSAAYVSACETSWECQLNGVCKGGECACDPGWTGDTCGLLKLAPSDVTKLAAYSQPKSATWGGNVVYEEATKTHHMFVSEIAPYCGMQVWNTNTQIVHATSNTGPLGPFKRQQVAIPAYADNPNAIRDPASGMWLLYHHGDKQGEHNTSGPCFSNGTTMPNPSRATGYLPEPNPPGFTPGGLLHVSESPDGPWRGLHLNASGVRGNPNVTRHTTCNNPTAFAFPNGTIALLCIGGAWCQPDGNPDPERECHTTVWVADRYDGVYRNYSGVDSPGDDPFMWHNDHGWHIWFHNGGGHVYSLDGVKWNANGTAPGKRGVPPAFTHIVNLTDGSQCQIGQYQRPKFLVDARGNPQALYCSANAVAPHDVKPPMCPPNVPGHRVEVLPGLGRFASGHDWTYTSARSIDA